MANFDHIQSSFLGGELSPRALGRLDLEIYPAGCSTLENFIVQPHGGASRRGGSKFVIEVKNSANTTLLLKINSKDVHRFILEIGEYYIRFYTDRAQVQNAYTAWETATAYVLGDLVTESATHYRCIIAHTSDTFATELAADKWVASGGATDLAYEIPTTYTAAQLSAINTGSDGEVLYLVHPLHAPAKLTRTSDALWTLEDLKFISFGATPAVAGTGYTIGEVLTIVQAGASGGTMGVLAIDSAGGVTKARTLTQGTLYKIEAALATTSSDAGVDCTIACSSDAPPPEWAAGNYPSLTWFFEQRLMFAATTDEPNGLWGSQSGDYFNFELGTGLDNQGLNIRVKQATKFVWAMATDLIMLGSTNGEFLIVASAADEALTPGNIRPIRATAYGSAALSAVEIDANAVFVQRGGRKVRRLQYDLAGSKYIARDIAILSEHITESGVVDVAYVNEPDSLIWVARDDGVLGCHTYDPDNNVFSWHRHVLGGVDTVVKSLAATNGQYDGQDELWMIVSRTIDSATVQYIEVLMQGLLDDEDQEDAFFVDSGVTATGSNLAEVTVAHLEGETVSILADGAVQAPIVVASGVVAISPVADKVHVGLSYSSTLDTLPLEGGNPIGTSQGKNKRIHSVVVRLHRSLGLWFGVPGETLDRYFFGPTTSMDDPIPLFTGDTEESPFPGGPDRQSLARFRQTDPLPLNILAIMMKASTDI